MSRILGAMVAVSATVSILAILLVGLAAYQVLFAPAPESFQVLPVPLASNPDNAPTYDFSNPRPTLHPGDQLVGDFHVCYSDTFGGTTVDVQGRRAIVSLSGTVRAPLNPVALSFPIGCHVTHTIIDTIPNPFPPGTYRVSGMTVAITPYYSRRVDWQSVPFEVAPVP